MLKTNYLSEMCIRDSDYPVYPAVIMCAATAFLLFLNFISPIIIYKRNHDFFQIPNRFTFSDDRMLIESESEKYEGQTLVKYRDLYKIYETKEFFYFFINQNQGFILLKSKLSGEDEVKLRAAIQSQVEKRKFIKC